MRLSITLLLSISLLGELTIADKPHSLAPDPFALVAKIKTRGPAPVHLWDPPFCGDIDLIIRRDGTWVHEGRPIRRQAMVRLFASILKREGEHYFLVTPVEKVGITVEDCPFLVISMDMDSDQNQQRLCFTTNTGEAVVADAEHPLRVHENPRNGEPHPVIHIRSNLWGLLSRAVFYRLVELAVPVNHAKAGVRPQTGQNDTPRENYAESLAVFSAGEIFFLGSLGNEGGS
ncbi:MAG: DUF1285 domain-containing protein [Gammaproteobacteria bacterium]|nr:DUF1285 domain-containing protein [Gammaproteobacteria bacterium]